MPASARKRPKTEAARLDQVFGALSDHTRRTILERLARGPAKVSELAEPFAMSLPAVSRHLKVLERAGLIERNVDGRVHHCMLATAPLEDAARWVTAQRGFWQSSLKSLARYMERETGGRR